MVTWYVRWGIGVGLVIQMYPSIPKRRSAKALEHLDKLNNQDLSDVYRNLSSSRYSYFSSRFVYLYRSNRAFAFANLKVKYSDINVHSNQKQVGKARTNIMTSIGDNIILNLQRDIMFYSFCFCLENLNSNFIKILMQSQNFRMSFVSIQ